MSNSPAIARKPSAAPLKLPLPALGAGGALVGGGLLMMNDVPLTAAAACVVPPLAVAGLSRWRSAKRRRVSDNVTEALTVLTGPGTVVKCSRWAKREYLHPRPERVEIRYPASFRDWDPKYVGQLLATVSSRIGVEYRVDRHPSALKRIHLVRDVDVEKVRDDSPRGLLAQKADVVVAELLGKESKAQYSWAGEDELAGIDVTFPNEIAVKLVSRMKRQSVERVITGTLPGRWRSSWDVENARASFRLRTEFPDAVPHPPLRVTDENRYLIPSAVTEDGDVVSWDLRSTVPHGLTTGRTGTGKTVVLLGTCAEWAGRDWAVWVADPKRVEFLGIRKWPNVQIVATTVEQQMALIWDAFELMERRYRMIEEEGADEDDFEPILVMADEYTEFRSAVNAWWSENKHKGAPAKCPVFNAVGSLARLARKARIHLRFGMQRPDAELLSGEVRDNLGDRHSLGRLSPQGAQMVWEAAYIGTSVPRKIPGRGTASGPDGQPVEAQAYWTPDPRKVSRTRKADDIAILEGLYPATTTHRRFVYEIEDSDSPTWLDADDKSSLYTPWAAITQARRVPTPDAEQHLTLEELLDELSSARDRAQGGAGDDEHEDREERPLRIVRDEPDEDELADDYGLVQSVCADRLRPGDLVNVDDDWVVVEEAVPDVEEDGMISIAWRSDDDDAGELAVQLDEMLEVRRMTEEE
ncbi:FtsK/SpoIIIE domain-containing protein [Brachybacterium sp. AOP25-B2-12]|uniref:FtsK/SpoIIIE domain-containing protein n=1 Tax=Brachybacterium sp. AOP25-B2-12 TaxID=3457710 RepID=UPI00403450DF